MSSPPKEPSSPTGGSRRRSSGLFENLMAQKRGPDNVAYTQRRQSLEEQGAQKGAVGKMWDRMVRGVEPAPK